MSTSSEIVQLYENKTLVMRLFASKKNKESKGRFSVQQTALKMTGSHEPPKTFYLIRYWK